MLFLTIIKVALKSLYANKLRSVLAMLGIIIGVAAVISMLSIGRGAQEDVMNRIQEMGTNLLSIRPGQRGHRGVMSGTQDLTIDDAEALITQIPEINSLSPVVQNGAQLKYYNNNTQATITGCALTYLDIRDIEVEHGRFFTDIETERMARVVVLGAETADNLELESANIGEDIKIKGIKFKLIGLLKEKGGGGWNNPDDRAFVPYSTAMNILFGMDSLRSIDVRGAAGADMSQLEIDITAVLRRQHGIKNATLPIEDPSDDFRVFNQADIIETASEFTKTFTFLLGGIAAISLLVGGIGIMNIMLVTVTERTKEIGIRKAIGAKNSDILKQFLIESLLMSGVGGAIGIVLGVAASLAIGNWSTFKTFVSPSSVVMAFSFSVFVGVFFGYYPAHRAAQLDPIECLYYE